MTLLSAIASLMGKESSAPVPAPPSEIKAEQTAIVSAPLVELGPHIGRCHWCGRPARRLTLVEVVNGQERHKGECCGG